MPGGYLRHLTTLVRYEGAAWSPPVHTLWFLPGPPLSASPVATSRQMPPLDYGTAGANHRRQPECSYCQGRGQPTYPVRSSPSPKLRCSPSLPGRLHNLDNSGMRCRQLDYIDGNDNRCTSSEALPSNRKEVTQIDRWPTGDRLLTGPTTASIRPAVQKRPNVIAVEPRKTADRPVICPANVVPTPQEVHKSHRDHMPESCSWRNRKLFQQKWPRRPARRALQIKRTFRTTRITSGRFVRR